MAWPGTISNQITGTLITATLWNELVDGINFLGNNQDHDGDPGDGATILRGAQVSYDGTAQTVANTTVETTLATHSIPAGLMGTTGSLLIELWGEGENLADSGGDLDFILRYGATELVRVITWTVASGANTPVLFRSFLTNLTTGTQVCDGFTISLASNNEISIDFGTSTEDSTGALDIVLRVQWTSASASASFRYHGSRVTHYVS